MTLSIDTSQAIRGTTELRLLVDAVVAANDHDEADWIEWKSALDLTTKEGCFSIARTVLGMANRAPERARATCQGLGFIVVGAEPGNLPGIASVDPAQLDQLIQPYLGAANGPRWTPTYMAADSKTVLVVSVEAPQLGDRIFTLRKEFDGSRSGTVFVRKHGRTVPADAEDLDALQRRLTAAPGAAGAALEVRFLGNVPLSWVDPETTRPAIERWADDRRNDLVAQAQEVERRRQQPQKPDELDPTGLSGLQAAMARQQDSFRRAMYQGSIGSFVEEQDTRTIDEYINQVEEWRGSLVEAAVKALPGAYVSHGHGVIALQIENLGVRFLPDVEVEVRFDFEGASGSDEEPQPRQLPAPPRTYGEPKPPMDLRPPRLFPPIATPDLRNIGRRTWVEDGSVVVKFGLGDLRQHSLATSDDVYVFVTRRPEDGVLHGTWRATVRDIDGVLTGAVAVPVDNEPVDVVKLLTTQRPGH